MSQVLTLASVAPMHYLFTTFVPNCVLQEAARRTHAIVETRAEGELWAEIPLPLSFWDVVSDCEAEYAVELSKAFRKAQK